LTRYVSLDKITEVFKPALDRIIKNEPSPRHKRRLEKKILHPEPETHANNPIESMVKQDPKVVLILTPQEASILKSTCALVKFSIVSKSSITQTRDTIDVLNMLMKKIDVGIKVMEMKQ
jgi:hypothetical protein